MLILTRRQGRPTGETVIIETPTGEQIELTVLQVKGSQVRIGTNAQDDMAIVRAELLEKLPAEE